jgi:hypothetical protein
MSESIKAAYEHYQDASQRFEYFIIGISVALVAYAGEKLEPQRLAVSPYMCEVIAIALIIASVVLSFLRMEKIILFHGKNIQILDFEERRGIMQRFLLKGEPQVNTESGELWKPEDMKKQISEFDRVIPELKKHAEHVNAEIAKLYSWRNFLLAVGFGALFIAKILTPYFHTAPPLH